MDELKRFVDFLLAKGASENTIAAYKNDLMQFQSYISSTDLNRSFNWQGIEPHDINGFIANLKEQRYAETSIVRKVSAVRSFLSYLLREGTIQTNPTNDIGLPTTVKKVNPSQTLTPKQVDKLLTQARKHQNPTALRDYAMLELMYATGMRVSDITSLDLDNINLNPSNPSVRYERGGWENFIPIHDQAFRALKNYIVNGRPRLARNSAERKLFLSKRGKPVTRQYVWQITKRYARQALGSQATPNTLRSSFADHLLNGGAKVKDVRRLLGLAHSHRSGMPTNTHLRKVYERIHPRATKHTRGRKKEG